MERAYLCIIGEPYVGACRKHVLQRAFGVGAQFVAKVLALLQNAWLVCTVVFMCTFDGRKLGVVCVPFCKCGAFVFGPRDVVVKDGRFFGTCRAFELTC